MNKKEQIEVKSDSKINKAPKKQKLPDMRNFNIENDRAVENIRVTEKEHVCVWCNKPIKIGSLAKRFIPIDILKQKVLVSSTDIEYVHQKKEDCVSD